MYVLKNLVLAIINNEQEIYAILNTGSTTFTRCEYSSHNATINLINASNYSKYDWH